MIIPLDPVGNVSLILQVAILFILILGLPFARGVGSNKNFVRHGYLTILALALHTILIFISMIPTFANGVGTITALPILNIFNVLSHAILGTTAEVLGFIVVGSWLAKPLKNMACLKTKKIMLPLFAIWTISLVNGALIHILGMF
jgi:cellulose synthase/poly-beta-1,6-N-acetylglucosamine synthase-like glycosyltransferase